MRINKETVPNKKGFFGDYGGRFVPPPLIPILEELTTAYESVKDDKDFKKEFVQLMKDYVGRPSPLYLAKNLSKKYGCKIYFKREDLNHTGAHKINNTIGQALLAKKMGKKKLIAETGAGQHGVATATAAALLGMECEIFMGEIDAKKQPMNIFRMELTGAKVNVVKQGGRTLKDAVDAALGFFINNPDVFYLLGSVVGPHPYPMMVRDFQKIIGEETKKQILEKEGRLPNYLVACVGGGSNAMGLFYEFLPDKEVNLVGVEPSGKGLKTGKHAATMTLGKPGTLHGFYSYLLQDKEGNPLPVYSIASGLDYPGVGPEQSFLKDIKRAKFETVTDTEALEAFHETSEVEGIIPALETSHALAHAFKLAKTLEEDNIMIVNFSGRGDKDVEFVASLH
ncbi:MAG: tryptophan synthase subunit beta [archaeon]